MRANLLDLSKSQSLLKRYIDLNPIDSKWSVRLSPSVSHAIAEVVRGLVKLYPHKQQAALRTGQSPFTFQFTETVARDGLKMVEFTDLDSDDEILGIVNEDILFVILAEDHPLTARLYPIETLIKKLTDKKIFTIVLKHNSHLSTKQTAEANPYVIEIRDHIHYAAVLLGSRSKKMDPLVLSVDMTFYDVTADTIEEDQSLVESFETWVSQQKNLHLYFSSSHMRMWDRSIIGYNGNIEPIYQALLSFIKNGKVITTSACTTSHPFNFNWWRDALFTNETQNQWIALDLRAIKEINNHKTLFLEALS